MEEELDTRLLVLQSHLDGMLNCIKRNSITLRKFQQFEMRLLQLDSLSEITITTFELSLTASSNPVIPELVKVVC